MRPLLICEPKVNFFLKGGLIVSKLGRNYEVLVVLQGPWKASGGGGLALEHEALGKCPLPFSAIRLVRQETCASAVTLSSAQVGFISSVGAGSGMAAKFLHTDKGRGGAFTSGRPRHKLWWQAVNNVT